MLVVSFVYHESMLTFCCMIFYLLIHRHTLIFTYYIHFDIIYCIGLFSCLLKYVYSLLFYD